jgi:hypothetical protein
VVRILNEAIELQLMDSRNIYTKILRLQRFCKLVLNILPENKRFGLPKCETVLNDIASQLQN